MHPLPEDAFSRLVAPYENALRLHCYRMLGSSHDTDDVVQETLVRAWRARNSLQDETALRPWLYRIATNACLDELKNRKQRPLPSHVGPASDPSRATEPANPEVSWLEPCPDAWLSGVTRDPAAVYELKESVALAFVAALQCLSAQQRAVLLLRDVLGLPAEETAAALELSVSATNSTLHRARTALRERVTGNSESASTDIASDVDETLLARYIRAWEAGDLGALVALLHEDVTLSMPPSPTWFSGRTATAAFLAARPLPALARASLRIVPHGANAQPALAFYVDGNLHALQVLRIVAGRVLEVHHFGDESSFAAFQLAHRLGEASRPIEPGVRAVANLDAGHLEVSVELRAAPERVFRALASAEIIAWWVRPGVFNATQWAGEVRLGGRWSVSGLGCGNHYVLEGQFLAVDAPRKLVHTWHRLGAPDPATTVTYLLAREGGLTRLTVRHGGFTSRAVCANTAAGWETSLDCLRRYLASAAL
jgi:RNA polymerase sigma-70 factor (ECF subfamily)